MITCTVVQHLREAQHIVAFTGAGTSAESGIPTFRGAMTGLYIFIVVGGCFYLLAASIKDQPTSARDDLRDP